MIFMCVKKVQSGINDAVYDGNYGIGDNFKSVEAITHCPRCSYYKCHGNTIDIFVGKRHFTRTQKAFETSF